MIVAETISAYPLTVIAIVVVIFAVLLARALKRDSGVRIARLGVFIERKRYAVPDDAGEIVSRPESDEATTAQRIERAAETYDFEDAAPTDEPGSPMKRG